MATPFPRLPPPIRPLGVEFREPGPRRAPECRQSTIVPGGTKTAPTANPCGGRLSEQRNSLNTTQQHNEHTTCAEFRAAKLHTRPSGRAMSSRRDYWADDHSSGHAIGEILLKYHHLPSACRADRHQGRGGHGAAGASRTARCRDPRTGRRPQALDAERAIRSCDRERYARVRDSLRGTQNPSGVWVSPAPPTAVSRCASRPRSCTIDHGRAAATSKAASPVRCAPTASRADTTGA